MNGLQRVVQTGLLKAYGAVTRTGVLDSPLVQRLYSRVYFIYKRRVERARWPPSSPRSRRDRW